MADTVLTVQRLGVTLGDHAVLKDISFTVERGKTFAFIGPNGSGKTVLFRAILDLLPHRGSVSWSGNARVGYVPQALAVDTSFPLTVGELFGCKGVSEDAASALLESVGVGSEHAEAEHRRAHIRDHVMSQRIGTLSSGQFQRMMIAWALADDPDVLLFDEPTSGIDIGGQESVYALLEQVKRERSLTLLLISHDLDVVTQYADAVLCVNVHLVCHGAPKQTLNPATLRKLYGESVAFPEHTNIHEH